MSEEQNSVSEILEDSDYKYGFTTDVESETFAKGLNTFFNSGIDIIVLNNIVISKEDKKLIL